MDITNLNLYLTIPETGNPILSTQQPEMSSGTTMEFNITGTFRLKNESKSSVRCGIAVFCGTQYLFDILGSASLASNGTSSETYDGSNKFSQSASVTDGDILIIGYKWDSTNGYALSDYEYLVGTLSQTLVGNESTGGQYKYSFSEQGKVTTLEGTTKTEMSGNMPAVS